jgi:2-polyprenyl-3-methyl-5-hydroxy-6-metoxy-1,4-benzoquinol methylase
MLFASPVEAHFIDGQFYQRQAELFYLSADKLEGDYARVRFARELRLFRQYCQAGAVLDVGCGTGGFLYELGRRFPGDYELLGTDVAQSALDYAKARGVPVLRDAFLEHDFGAQPFDAITFWAVLEHLNEPRRFLAKANALLKPGGHCFILVPNMRSLAARILNTRYRYIMAEHLNYFTPATLKRFVAREAGLRLVTMKFTHFNPVVLWQDWRQKTDCATDAARGRLLKRTTAWKQHRLLRPLGLLYAALESVLGALQLTDNLAVVLQRG